MFFRSIHPHFDANHLLKIYAPGNEWQIEQRTTSRFNDKTYSIQYDSIINSQLLPNNNILITTQSFEYSYSQNYLVQITSTSSNNGIFNYQQSAANLNLFVSTTVRNTIPVHILNYDLTSSQPNYLDHWVVDTFCDMFILHAHTIVPGMLNKSNNCFYVVFQFH